MVTYPYTSDRPRPRESADELRARIPGWGADLDPADRPSYPRELLNAGATGAHWGFPDRQPEHGRRERSIEHAMLTPAFGTAQPLHGLSGVVRRYAYRRHSEAKAAHWLLLLAGDRIDVVEHVLRSLVTRRPDNPVTQSGIRAEVTHGGWSSRLGQGRSDIRHHALDPLVNSAPWAVSGYALYRAVRAIRQR